MSFRRKIYILSKYCIDIICNNCIGINIYARQLSDSKSKPSWGAFLYCNGNETWYFLNTLAKAFFTLTRKAFLGYCIAWHMCNPERGFP